jgi:hypothetical protein
MSEVQKQWYKSRVEAILSSISVYDILRHQGAHLSQVSDDREEQISCPFHGADNKPSARVYPEQPDNPSHVWCYVCQVPGWDAIGLWREYQGGKESCTFSQALFSLEKEFNLETPDMPTASSLYQEKAKVDTTGLDSFKELYVACEHRLVSCRSSYQYLNDLSGYLIAGSILDQVAYRVSKQIWEPSKGSRTLQELLVRIKDVVASCPGG